MDLKPFRDIIRGVTNGNVVGCYGVLQTKRSSPTGIIQQICVSHMDPWGPKKRPPLQSPERRAKVGIVQPSVHRKRAWGFHRNRLLVGGLNPFEKY